LKYKISDFLEMSSAALLSL